MADNSKLDLLISELCDDEPFSLIFDENPSKKICKNLLLNMNKENKRNKKPNRIKNYVWNIIPTYNFNEFKSHFRMSRSTFQILAEWLQPKLNKKTDFIPLEFKLYVVLWILGNQESFRGVSDRFDISKGTAHYIFSEICELLCKHNSEIIKWPNAAEMQQTSTIFEEKWGISGCFGAIDGCHIAIKQPVKDAGHFYNRKSFYSVVLQAVCNEKMVFIDIYVGSPGRMHDARIFRKSGVYNKLTGSQIPQDMHILGDCAYPLQLHLLTPYRDNGHLTDLQKRYNIKHSSARSIIERSFSFLKGKFRRLKFLDMSSEKLIPVVIMATCVLHNIILQHEITESEEQNYELDSFDQEENSESISESYRITDAIFKRNSIAENL